MKLRMEKIKFAVILVCVIGFCAAFLGLSLAKGTNTDFAYADETESSNYGGNGYEYAYMSYPDKMMQNEGDYTIPFTANLSSGTIVDFTYSSDGLDVLSSNITDATHIEIKVKNSEHKNQCSLVVNIQLSSQKNLYAYFYGIYTTYGFFVSKYSEDDAMENYLQYALDNELMFENQADVVRAQYYRTGIVDLNLISETSNIGNIPTNSLSNDTSFAFGQPYATGDTYAHGKIEWKDRNGTSHPLQRVKVEVCDSDANNTYDLLATTYTDLNGEYSVSFTNMEVFELNGRDLFIRVYAGDGVTNVYKNNETTPYIYETGREEKQNVNTGSNTFIGCTFSMDSPIGQAMQIAHAMLTAQNFYKTWSGLSSLPKTLKIVYPSDYTHYKKMNETIYIVNPTKPPLSTTSTSALNYNYEDWDVLMHEYGHFVISMQTLRIWGEEDYNSRDLDEGWYKLNINLADHFYRAGKADDCDDYCPKHGSVRKFHLTKDCKKNGLEKAWVEALATIFSALCQETYASQLNGIIGIADGYHTDTFRHCDDALTYNNSDVYLGDGCPISIASVLWKMYDKNASNNGELPYNTTNFYNLLYGTRYTNFSFFLTSLLGNNPKFCEYLGSSLAQYGMAPKITGTYSGVYLNNGMESKTLTWNAPNGSQYYPTTSYRVNVYSQDYSRCYHFACNTTSCELNTQIFLNTSSFNGEILHVLVRHVDSEYSLNSGFPSNVVNIKKRVLKYEIDNDEAIIVDTYCDDLFDSLSIPSQIDGINIKAIGDNVFENMSLSHLTFESSSVVKRIGKYAFRNCTELKTLAFPKSVEIIDNDAFYGCSNLLTASYSGTSLTTIGDRAFYNTNLSILYMPICPSLKSIGSYAFGKIKNTGSIILTQNVTFISNNAFSNCDNLTIYTERSVRPITWSTSWNNSNRPVFWECTLSSDKSYVVSFVKSSSNPANSDAINGINAPYRSGYNFDGWYTTSDFSGTQYTDVTAAPNGTLYAKWTDKSCVAEGSLITLADGSQVAVENLTGNEDLLVWNMLTGQFDVAPILFIDSDPVSSYEIIKLTFSDGTFVKVIDEHAFFDMTLNKYVFLRNDAAQYVGHVFNKQTVDENGENVWTAVTLTDVTVYTETTTAWSPVTYGHLCYYVNGMLSMPGATEGFINIFEVDPTTMKYDEAQMAEDIAEYGLYTYEEFNEIIPLPEVIFNAFNGQYLKVSIGKGLITLDEIRALIERYSAFFAI